MPLESVQVCFKIKDEIATLTPYDTNIGIKIEERIRIRAYDQPCVNAVKGGTISALALRDVQALLTTALL